MTVEMFDYLDHILALQEAGKVVLYSDICEFFKCDHFCSVWFIKYGEIEFHDKCRAM